MVQGDETLVQINVFNVVTYVVRLPLVMLEPVVYRQNTKDGSRTISRTLVPNRLVDKAMTTLDGFQGVFAKRVDAIIAVGSYKSDITTRCLSDRRGYLRPPEAPIASQSQR